MDDLDTREWLLTNGLGSFASGTVSDIRTRTYHGWLFASTNPPSGRTLLLSHLEASLEVSGKVVALGTNIWGTGEIAPTGYKLLRSFDVNPVPKWIWGEGDWQLSRQLVMPYGVVESGEECELKAQESQFRHRLLIHYRYEGRETAVLRLRLLIADRDFHHQQTNSLDLQFSQVLGNKQIYLQAMNSGSFGTPWQLRWSQGEYQANAVWYWRYGLPEETQRGLGDREDLHSPGYLTVTLQPGDTVTLEARMGFPAELTDSLTSDTFAEAVEAEQERLSQVFGWEWGEDRSDGEESFHISSSSPLWQQLLKAGDQFIVYRDSIAGPTVIAGYHWFNDWGRDTLIALPGLALVPKRFELAKGLLQTFGRYCRHGLIPNAFPDIDSEPYYNSIDAALWWIETLGLYLEATQDWQFLAEQFPTVQQIYKAYFGGTRYNIQLDATDGLIGWDAPNVALTWMDAVVGGEPMTPRPGKAVEINALWYSALCWLSQWAERLSQMDLGDSVRLEKQGRRYAQQAQQVKASLQKFWNPQLGYLYDTIDLDDRRNAQIRPNAILALSLHHCGFSQKQGQQILDLATYRLLTPYGLRSLDPADPEYIGRYEGNPEKRDRAYHQGTVWTWLIGPFIRAWQRFYPEQPLPFDWQPLLDHFLSDACLGSISEIFDGDPPHRARGAVAQAWSVAEVIRHLRTT
ncbi:Glycogen debranching enzyme [Trichormus variabilis ATCC 29413]|uniref:Glycogen debranching enzyme n=2 Tax=Anabaena variabilis TaxID=264691 RepID=Q3MBI9_TRIV2|nr:MULTISPECIES: amylo-alpha-1,6-glucosidase [Nostocaceae]ABA21647.1 Glycogen debranching enzyme [Trichormus variabilis ATCC 29413]MBC1215372.1 amylo-alpha-1,6-glucosidase [Trichormus variabilis ARAD]MBC1255056.1 amylo-alpha-1,6-glucosidase [Trichormus variabilis V5]MBC1268605.1 amylo-alpha-1,6-glucosidase [Trichormus variabilis FSR]MBC1302278.1 amylo-alpha-1,6-glucosidase [Trichormus variabilis N2B]